MKYLLDTQCWLWWISSPQKLNDDTINQIENSQNEILFSVASSWEISIKYAIGKLKLSEPPKQFIPKRLARDSFTTLRMEHIHALHVSELPPHHRDPFDRLIIAQSQVESIPIMTADRQFERYDVPIIDVNKKQ